METATVINSTRSRTLARAKLAVDRADRRRGLLGTASLPEGEGLLIEPCRSVHTMGMAYPIDVLFMAGDGRVVKAVRGLRPGRITRPVLAARMALELPAGTIEASGTLTGDRLEFVPPAAPIDSPSD